MLQEWIGRQEHSEDEVTLAAVRRLAALLDRSPDEYRRGAPIPGGWYVVLFTPEARQSELGPDGHPRKGQFLPPVPFPRRMFAGRRVWFREPLRVGDSVSRVSRIAGITPKRGRSGEMCFVTVRHEISTPRGLAVAEEQDIVYREAAAAAGKREAAAPAGPPEWSRELVPDPAMVFRYSALTFNAHRIHYDAAYAREEEGYPGLVVNGGLTTLLLWELAAAQSRKAITASVSRNVKPLFVGRPLRLHGRPVAGDRIRMWALDSEGELAIDAELAMG
ncbi:MAG TPA: MaoC family dehydratase N-terminal domain-containing protein [Burkholderiales bacterium]|nr:MaoC family dehydratase N-terminal domain-containing protein [Burkholderiales bacterium]